MNSVWLGFNHMVNELMNTGEKGKSNQLMGLPGLATCIDHDCKKKKLKEASSITLVGAS